MVGRRARATVRTVAAVAVFGGSLILYSPSVAASAPPVIRTIPMPANPQLVAVDSTVATGARLWGWFRFRPPGGAEPKPVSGPEVGVEAVTG